MKRVVGIIAVLLLFLTSASAGQQDNRKLLLSILDDGLSGNREPAICQLLRQGAQTLDIPALAEWATMLENKVLDTGDRQVAAVSKGLLDYAEKHYGPESYEAVSCRRQLTSRCLDEDWGKAAQLAAYNEKCVLALCKKQPRSNDCLLLKLNVQIEHLSLLKQHDPDNPFHWKKLLEIEKELEPLLKVGKASIGLVDACLSIANLKTYETTNQTYINYVREKMFPHGHLMLGRDYGDGMFSNSETFLQKAVELSQALWKKDDLRRLRTEIEHLALLSRYRLAEYDSIHTRLIEIHTFLKEYLPDDDSMILRTELLKWDADLSFGQNLDEIRNPYPMLFKISSHYGTYSEEYLRCLLWMAYQQSVVSPQRVGQMTKEIIKINDELFRDSVDIYVYNLSQIFPLMQVTSQDNPSDFHAYLSKLSSSYQTSHHASWPSVAAGKRIGNVYMQYLQLPDNGLSFYRTALDDVCRLVGNDSFLYAASLAEYAEWQQSSYQQDTLQSAANHYRQAISLYRENGQSTAGLWYGLSVVHSLLGDTGGTLHALREGIAASVKKEDGMWRCLMQLRLGDDLLNSGRQGVTEEIRQLYEEAIPFYMEHVQNVGGTYLHGYSYIADYYRELTQFEKAAEVLSQGISHYESLYGANSSAYTDLISALFKLYAYDLNDMDKADQVMQGRIESIRQNASFSLHSSLLQLLWNRYDLIKRKFPNEPVRLFPPLADVKNELMTMIAMAGENASQLKPLVKPFLYEFGTLFRMMGEHEQELFEMKPIDGGVSQEVIDSMKSVFVHFKEMSENDLLPIYKAIEEELKEQGSDWRDMTETANLYQAMSDYYLFMEHDTVQAESYYRELMMADNLAVKFYSTYTMAKLKMSFQQYEEAVVFFDKVGELLQRQPQLMTSADNKASFNNYLASLYYQLGRYQDAIKPAQQLYQYRQQLIAQNFDYLTQQEREAFLIDGGVGGDGLRMLLPHFPQQLAAQGYNVALSEKGILLRSSERVRRTVAHSGDAGLKAMLDSLDQLTAEFKTMSTSRDWVHGEYGYDTLALEKQRQIDDLERSINRQVAPLVDSMRTPDWRQLQKVLQPGEAAVEYVLSDTLTCGALVLLPQGVPQYVPLSPSNELWHGLARLSRLNAKAKAEALYQQDELKLYRRLWQPIEPLLKAVKTVYYSPSGFLNDIAFAAIKCTDGSHLIDHYELHQMLSTGDLVTLRGKQEKKAPQTSLLYGAVFYSPDQQELARQILAGSGNRGMAEDERGAIVDDDETFGYLSFTRQETEDVKRMMQEHNMSAQLMTGFQPTEQVLHDISGHSPDVLHLSTHGFFVPNDNQINDNRFLSRFPSTRFSSMQRSGLALVDANRTWNGATDRPENADGIITANEVALLDLSNTRLAVLSACQTAVGEYSLEGVYGMHRGFKQAGVQSILATLWNVNDKSTARLMKLFYERWLSGRSMQQSLNEAVKELRKEYPSPFYWAPFMLLDAL